MQFIIYNVYPHTTPQHYAQILEYNGYRISMPILGGSPRWAVDVDDVESLVKISDIVGYRLVITSKNDDNYNWPTDGKYNMLLIYDDYME